MTAQPTLGVNIRVTVEEYARAKELKKVGASQRDIFMAGMTILEDRIKIDMTKNISNNV